MHQYTLKRNILSLTTFRQSKSPLSTAYQDPKEREKISGPNGSNWKGGISFLPYCIKFNSSLKRAIRKRDHYTCQRCGIKQKKTWKKIKRSPYTLR